MPDEFYLCFDQLGSRQNVCSEFAQRRPAAARIRRAVRRTSVCAHSIEINATMAAITGVSPNNAAVKTTFDNVRAVVAGDAGYRGVPVLASDFDRAARDRYCSALVDDTRRAQRFFGSDFGRVTLPAA